MTTGSVWFSSHFHSTLCWWWYLRDLARPQLSFWPCSSTLFLPKSICHLAQCRCPPPPDKSAHLIPVFIFLTASLATECPLDSITNVLLTSLKTDLAKTPSFVFIENSNILQKTQAEVNYRNNTSIVQISISNYLKFHSALPKQNSGFFFHIYINFTKFCNLNSGCTLHVIW